eukprot:g4331.t1
MNPTTEVGQIARLGELHHHCVMAAAVGVAAGTPADAQRSALLALAARSAGRSACSMPLFQLTNSSANPRDPQFTARRTRRGAMAASAIWEVVGGAEKGGILVREEADLKSAELHSRLAPGVFVQQVALQGERLHFSKLCGDGPDSGWVSLRLKEKPLLEQRGEATSLELETLDARLVCFGGLRSGGEKELGEQKEAKCVLLAFQICMSRFPKALKLAEELGDQNVPRLIEQWEKEAEKLSSLFFPSQRDPETLEVWRAAQVHLLVADFRGYGFSGGTSSHYHLRPDGEAIVQFLPELPWLGGWALYGNGLGSRVACFLAALHGSFFTHGLLLETPWAGSYAPGAPPLPEPPKHTALATMGCNAAGESRFGSRELHLAAAALGQKARQLLPGRPEAAAHFAYVRGNEDLIQAYEGHVLILHGEVDHLVPPEHAVRLHRAARRAKSRHLLLAKGKRADSLPGSPDYATALHGFFGGSKRDLHTRAEASLTWRTAAKVIAPTGRLRRVLQQAVLSMVAAGDRGSREVFCPKCGNDTVVRVPILVDQDGVPTVLNSGRKLRTKGTVFSMPKPQGGRVWKPIFAEDVGADDEMVLSGGSSLSSSQRIVALGGERRAPQQLSEAGWWIGRTTRRDHQALCFLLLDGADVEQKTSKGKSALDLAQAANQQGSHDQVISMLTLRALPSWEDRLLEQLDVYHLPLSFWTWQVLATGGDDKHVNIWKVGKPNAMMSLKGHTSAVECLVFDKQEEVLIVGCAGGSMQKIWDLRRKSCIQTYPGHSAPVSSIRFSPHGRWVATGGLDNQVKIWDLTAGKQMKDLDLHKAGDRRR